MRYRQVSAELRRMLERSRKTEYLCAGRPGYLADCDCEYCLRSRADERTTTTACTYCGSPVPVPEMGAPTEGGPPMCAGCRAVRDDVMDTTVTAKEEQ